MSMGALLGVATLYYLWREPVPPFEGSAEKESAAARRLRREAQHTNLGVVTVLASLYWVTQASAYFYPGSGASDRPERDPWWAQACIEAVALSLTGIGWWLESRALALDG
jgi:hypothetical protein